MNIDDDKVCAELCDQLPVLKAPYHYQVTLPKYMTQWVPPLGSGVGRVVVVAIAVAADKGPHVQCAMTCAMNLHSVVTSSAVLLTKMPL